jgi:hypothetical protein
MTAFKATFSFILTVGLSSLAQAASAQPAPAKSSMATTVVSSKEKKESKDWSLGFSYGASTNLMKEERNRDYKNVIGSELTIQNTKRLSTSLETSFHWMAQGNNISREEDASGWDDLTLGLAYQYPLADNWSLSASLQNAFPTGNESRQEGIRSATGAGLSTNVSFFQKQLGLNLSTNLTKVSNSYDYSRTSGQSNTDLVSVTSIGAGYSVTSYLRLSLSHSICSIRNVHGELFGQSSSSVSMGTKYKNMSASLGYSVGTYEENDGYRFMYLDDTKQVVKLGVGFEI